MPHRQVLASLPECPRYTQCRQSKLEQDKPGGNCCHPLKICSCQWKLCTCTLHTFTVSNQAHQVDLQTESSGLFPCAQRQDWDRYTMKVTGPIKKGTIMKRCGWGNSKPTLTNSSTLYGQTYSLLQPWCHNTQKGDLAFSDQLVIYRCRKPHVSVEKNNQW